MSDTMTAPPTLVAEMVDSFMECVLNDMVSLANTMVGQAFVYKQLVERFNELQRDVNTMAKNVKRAIHLYSSHGGKR